ncbi:hypothetical protein ACP70R_040352 [Stipagrostis hirtigluma subsp. patula]
MGACGVAALAVLLLASALFPSPATARVLEDDQASSGEGAPAPATTAGGSPKSDASAESGHSSAAGEKPESKGHQEARPSETTSKDSKVTSSSDSEKKGQKEVAAQDTTPAPPPVQVTQPKKGQEGSEEQVSTQPPPPPQVTRPKEGQEGGDVQASRPPPPPVQVTPPPPPPPVQVTPPPGGPGPEGGGEPQGGSEEQDTGTQGKEETAGKMKEIMEKCDASHKCSFGGQFSACLQVSQNASIGSFVVVLNQGQDDITVNVKATPSIGIDMKPQHLGKGVFRQVDITHITPDGGEITLNDGNGDCVLHIGRSVSDWQQQFEQFTAYATRLNPIYGASFFVFTVVLVGAVCACCKFARRRGNDAVPYQQLEMGAQAPNSSGVDNTTSTADGWEDGWDDDWDDEEAPAKPSDKNPATSVSSNGLSLRSQTNGKDGWDVDWDD